MSGLPDGTYYTKNARALYQWIPMLDGAETKIVFALADATWGESTDHVWLTLPALCTLTGLSMSTARDARNALVAAGAILYKPGKTTRKPGAYRINLKWKPANPLKTEGFKPTENNRVQGVSHLKPPENNRDCEPTENQRVNPLKTEGLLNTISKTKKDSSPLPSGDPQGGSIPKKSTGFTPPLIEEVTAFMATVEKHRPDDPADAAEEFVCHFRANGWRVGRPPGTPMRDWQAAARTWLRPKDWQVRGRASPPGQGRGLGDMRDETLGWLEDG